MKRGQLQVLASTESVHSPLVVRDTAPATTTKACLATAPTTTACDSQRWLFPIMKNSSPCRLAGTTHVLAPNQERPGALVVATTANWAPEQLWVDAHGAHLCYLLEYNLFQSTRAWPVRAPLTPLVAFGVGAGSTGDHKAPDVSMRASSPNSLHRLVHHQ